VKVKVGGERAIARDVPRLAAVRERIGTDVRLRLDANQSLAASELAPALDAYARFGVELIEEPATPELVTALGASPIPIALDESLADDGWEERLATCAAVVLKPMALGGLARCLAIADAAHAAGAAVIVTHLFDGPVAAASAACLALAVRGRVLPCGLDVNERLGGAVLAIGDAHVTPLDVPGIGVREDGANR
jgi:L-alanine-DL-glutamate epimerase-like enolase superfamily enzyme